MFIDELENRVRLDIERTESLPFLQKMLVGNITKIEYVQNLSDLIPWTRSASKMCAMTAGLMSPFYLPAKEFALKAAAKAWNYERFLLRDLHALGASWDALSPPPMSASLRGVCEHLDSYAEEKQAIGALGTLLVVGTFSTRFSLNIAANVRRNIEMEHDATSFYMAHGYLDADQPDRLHQLMQMIIDPVDQRTVASHAKTTAHLVHEYVLNFPSAIQPWASVPPPA